MLILWVQHIRGVKAVDTTTADTTTINWPALPAQKPLTESLYSLHCEDFLWLLCER